VPDLVIPVPGLDPGINPGIPPTWAFARIPGSSPGMTTVNIRSASMSLSTPVGIRPGSPFAVIARSDSDPRVKPYGCHTVSKRLAKLLFLKIYLPINLTEDAIRMVEADLVRFGDKRLACVGGKLLAAMQRKRTFCLHRPAKDRNQTIQFGRFLANPR
jgi:hypothetical protein